MKLVLVIVLAFIVGYTNAQTNIPAPSGSYAVGRRLIHWVDSSRTDPIDTLSFRTLPVWIWYPAVRSSDTKPEKPLPDEWAMAQAAYLNQKVGDSASQFLQSLRVWAKTNAKVADGKEKFPVLLFGPGHTWLPTDYSTIIEEIVSHGYIVVGYVPTGFPSATLLPDGKLIPQQLTVPQQDIVFEDALFVRRQLHLLEKSWLAGRIDTKTVGIFGHSQGGIAATVLASRDSTIKASVNFDGDLMGSALKARVHQPALLLSNEEDIGIAMAKNEPEKRGRIRSEYRRHADWMRATDETGMMIRVRINGTRHLNFNDLALVPAESMSAVRRKDRLGPIKGAEGLLRISKLTLTFFDCTLKSAKPLYYSDFDKPESILISARGLKYDHER